jgi:APA family basic amino acid/polyamine antiporter
VSPATLVLSGLMVVIGVMMVVTTLARGGGPLATGGAGRRAVRRRRRRAHPPGAPPVKRHLPDRRAATAALSRMDAPDGLRRGLGSPALFGIVQSFTAASIYFGLGLIADSARGFTWAVLLAASVFFVLLVLSYVEGASLHQERGGATIIARYGFNELWSFVAGWAILFDYVVLIGITAFVATDYLAVFWPALADGTPELVTAGLVIALVAFANVRGVGPQRFERVAILVIADLALQIAIVVAGLLLLVSSDVLTSPVSFGGRPPLADIAFAFTLAVIAFAGIDASSGWPVRSRSAARACGGSSAPACWPGRSPTSASPSWRSPPSRSPAHRRRRPQPHRRTHARRRRGLEQAWLRETSALPGGGLGRGGPRHRVQRGDARLARLGYSLALNRQIPTAIGGCTRPTRPPSWSSRRGALLAFALIIPSDLEFLAGIYASARRCLHPRPRVDLLAALSRARPRPAPIASRSTCASSAADLP